jgi:putative methionine-R-sulfoxide reductase with GAF domain
LLKVFGIVDVDSDTSEFYDDAGFASCLRGRMVRFEAIVAEAQRE